MSANSIHWDELVEFAHCEPSTLAFRAIVALLDTWSTEDQEAAIEYTDKLLGKWPDAVRIAPWSWCKAVSKGNTMPTWRLVRALQLTTDHLTKSTVNLARLAHHVDLSHITLLDIPWYSNFQELSFLYHRPETFPALKRLRAVDKYNDGDVRALSGSPIWQTLERFEIEDLTDSLVHREDASRIIPQFARLNCIHHLTLRAYDLMAVWDAYSLPQLRSASVFIRSLDEALALSKRNELSQLTSLSIAFRCGFNGSSPFEPFLGNVIEADEAAADAFFRGARLDKLAKLAISGYSAGHWEREGMGRLGLQALIASGLLHRLKHLRLRLLPLGDKGIVTLAPALGKQLEKLELINVYCKGDGAEALSNSPCMSSLRYLDLSANRIDSERAAQMAKVDMPHLESLDLSGPWINPYYMCVGQQPVLDLGATAWANSANARQLRHLRLRNCYLTDEALTAIFQSPQLAMLAELDLSHNLFTHAGIQNAVVDSSLWKTLEKLGLNDCRLDNAAIKALSQVSHAPALRALELCYNSIGPKGATALANWPVLSRVWKLDLHDNIIGDEGLIAISQSPYLSRLLELDLEQDCWNSRTFMFNDDAARALASSKSLSRLDGMFSGCVDEYHGTSYSSGFSKAGLDAVRKSVWMRPAFKAACSDFSGISDYSESPAFNEEMELRDRDFRYHPLTLYDKEAGATEHRMQQISSPFKVKKDFDEQKPPKISPLPELEFADEDIIEGIEFREATPTIDHYLRFSLSLKDSRRPLPNQTGKFLADALDNIFKASSLGYFNVSGARYTKDEEIEVFFSLGIKGDPQPAIQLIREALWWIGAPQDTEFKKNFRLALAEKPATTTTSFLQLATLEIVRWNRASKPGYRIDRIPFSSEQREDILRILANVGASESDKGWMEVATRDRGRVTIYTKYLDKSLDFDSLNILIEALTPEVSGLIYRLAQECAFLLLPMAFAASEEVARTIDCDWPKIQVVESAAKLHELLACGPMHWWRKT